MDSRAALAVVIILCILLVGLAYIIGLRTGELRRAAPPAAGKSQPDAGSAS